MDEFDLIVDMRLANEGKLLKLIQLRKKVPYAIDWNLLNLNPDVKKMDNHRFDDRSIYKYGLTYVQNHDSLNRFINSQLSKGNLISFPEKEF